ncbi:MAG: phosphoribosylformylglycinamidine cyclo-ligase [bacterium]
MNESNNDIQQPLTYRDAGVDIDAGNALVERIKPHTQRTKRPEVLSGIGGFGALMSIPSKYNNPILVSGTDGVGTKLKLAIDTQRYDTIGIDLVAMCVNDIVVTGAEPLFFLDYYATGKLDNDIAESVVKGIADGCVMAGAALIGGETAEMPGLYAAEDFDLAGFSVGVVERDAMLAKGNVCKGDVIIGLASSGAHSNGYSLIRKIISQHHIDLQQSIDANNNSQTLADALLQPTRIYVKPVLQAIKEFDVHAVAHITGGGLTENIPRVLPARTKAVIHTKSWQRLGIFDWLQQQGRIEEDEMLRTFNCGIGMVMVMPAAHRDDIIGLLKRENINAWQIGWIESCEQEQAFVEYSDAPINCPNAN